MNQVLPSASLVSRVMVLIYGLVSYTIGVAGLGCIVAALATWIPFGFLETTSPLPLLLTKNFLITQIRKGMIYKPRTLCMDFQD